MLRRAMMLSVTLGRYVVVVVTMMIVVIVDGWGQKGHEIVGNVASSLLSENALYRVAKLLNVSQVNSTASETTATSIYVDDHRRVRYLGFSSCDEHCTPLAIVADWADQIRFRYHWSAPLHYIDIRDDIIPNGCHVVPTTAKALSVCAFNYTRDCPNDACVAGAIVNYTEQLSNGYAQHYERGNLDQLQQLKESLMFLVHFIGDIHQPLHCSRTTDRGGNTIHVHFDATASLADNNPSSRNQHRIHENNFRLRHHRYGRDLRHHSLNLHAVWDDSIIETILERDFDYSRNALEANLLSYIWNVRTTDPSLYNNIWLGCADATDVNCSSQWAEQSFQYALKYAYANVDGNEVVNGTVLDEQYYQTRQPIVRERLAVAAVRLATNLEQIFGD
jgi:hypothetical protein